MVKTHLHLYNYNVLIISHTCIFYHCPSGIPNIIEGNVKLILTLVWRLILHYEIDMTFKTDDDYDDYDGPKHIKQAFLEYIQV